MNYQLIGGDGKEYGPVSDEQIRVWFGEGRLGPATQVGNDRGEWKPLAQHAEFAELFQAPPPLTPATPGMPPPVVPLNGTSTTPALPTPGSAMTSVVCGIVSVFLVCTGIGLIPAIIAIACGHTARRRIAAAPDTLGGVGAARLGIILGYIGLALNLIVILVLLGLLLPALAHARSAARRAACMNNERQVMIALITYADDNQDALPPDLRTLRTAHFADDPNLFRCQQAHPKHLPHDGGKDGGAWVCDYDYFGAGVKLSELKTPQTQVILADHAGNHRNGMNLAFADGRVQFIKGKDLRQIAQQNQFIVPEPPPPRPEAGP